MRKINKYIFSSILTIFFLSHSAIHFCNAKSTSDNYISHSEFIVLISDFIKINNSKDYQLNELMQLALDKGWYDWDEIPPTGEKYNAPIKKKLATKIIMNSILPEAKGDYSKWSPIINDFSLIDARYYEAIFSAYESGIIISDDNGNFNPNNYLTYNEAYIMIEKAIQKSNNQPIYKEKLDAKKEKIATTKKGVFENGHLQVIGTQLSNKEGEAIELKGMSSHGIHWFPQFVSYDTIKMTKDYGANVFRIAMYTDQNGYISNRSIKENVIKVIDDAIELDMYVIVDWHILYDNNPNIYLEEAKEFFANISEIYKDNPAVIYEICNEPNGDVSWEKDIKPYAEQIIPIIRKESPSSIILVGTSTWSQDVDHVYKSPLEYENIMYTCHFYAGTHGDELQNKINIALENNTPVFISEWGTSKASGDEGVFIEQSKQWLDFLSKHKISWINWSLCNKDESSSALKSYTTPNELSFDDLSESGQFVFEHFK